MRFAYADPPYLGMCGRYEHNHPDGRCWDEPETHRALVESLSEYDGWALSLHLPALRTILPMVPEDARVLAWCKTWASWKPGVFPASAWEPVILSGPAKRRWKNGDAQTPRDWFACVAMQNGFFGAKPEPMIWWLFSCLGIGPDDEFVDLFPGSGAVTRAWESWSRQLQLGVGLSVASSGRAPTPDDLGLELPESRPAQEVTTSVPGPAGALAPSLGRTEAPVLARPETGPSEASGTSAESAAADRLLVRRLNHIPPADSGSKGNGISRGAPASRERGELAAVDPLLGSFASLSGRWSPASPGTVDR